MLLRKKKLSFKMRRRGLWWSWKVKKEYCKENFMRVGMN